MGWTNCECGAELDPPTPDELIRDQWQCPQCTRIQEISEIDREVVLLDLYQRFVELENTVKELKERDQ